VIRRQARFLGAGLLLADAAAMVGCFLAAFHLKRLYILPDPQLDFAAYRGLLAVEAPVIMAIFLAGGLYSSRTVLAPLARQAGRVGRSVLIAFGAFMAVSFYAKMFEYSRAVFTLFFVLLAAALVVDRLLLAAAGRLIRRSPAMTWRVLAVGSGDLAGLNGLAREMTASPFCRFEVLKVAAGGPGAASPEEALRQIEQGRVDCVLVDLPPGEFAAASAMIDRAGQEGVAVYVTRRILPAGMLNMAWESLCGTPLIALRPRELPLAGRFLKRAMDLGLSLLGLLLLSLPLAAIAAAVKLTSPGPVLYRQRRVGRDGREFTILKFRSMRSDAEEVTGPVWAEADDPRCTRLGAFLRRSFLDELPQLWNVLRGDMSLVGPRPERPEFVRQFKKEIQRYAHKHWVRPGITGWAQVNGWRGDTDLAERIRHDIWYIENWSVWLDLRVLAATAFRLLSRAW
jgi:exopolysaccharide biosynthesis polyprenyl glycosylphosphotransferase